MKRKSEILWHLREDLEREYKSILGFWMRYMIDEKFGGFHGSLNNDLQEIENSAKGVVLNSRILWTFSIAYLKDGEEEFLRIAKRAYEYIRKHFIDEQYGGVFWSVDEFGNMKEGRKQTYGQAFCIYGLSEYYKATNDPEALKLATQIFFKIEEKCFDSITGGYFEAFARDWSGVEDNRLSEKDQNERKTMNTHLHVIEAYSNLYQCWKDELLLRRIENLLENFRDYIVDFDTGHLRLFMDDDWKLCSTLISFGHDIEASWLLRECAMITGNELLIEQYDQIALVLANAANRGLDEDGGLWYEYDPANDFWIREKHSWPQAEALVGFLNAWELSANDEWLAKANNVWKFISQHLKDNVNGEWYWGVTAKGELLKKEKAGFWKCPYHSVRACVETIKRIDLIITKKQQS